MSAFVVTDELIHRILTHLRTRFASFSGVRLQEDAGCSRLGKKLLTMNVKAVSYRYQEPALKIEYTFKEKDSSQVQHLADLKCFAYECTEGNVPNMDLYKLMEMYTLLVARDLFHQYDIQLPDYTKLPVWKSTTWG